MELKMKHDNYEHTITDPARVMAIFTNLLFEKAITKESAIDKIDYKYNYPNVNVTITFKSSNLVHEYINIPSDGHSLAIADIEKLLKGGE